MENRYKLKEFFGVPNIIEEARKSAEAKAKPGKKPGLIWILTLLISIGRMIVSEIVMIFPAIPLNLILKKIGSENPDYINSTVIMGIQLYLLIIITIIHCLYVRFIEKRKLRTIGFVKKGAAVQYLIGLGIGFGIFTLAVLFCALTGSIKVHLADAINIGPIIFCFGGWLIQGMEEEVCCRGFLMTSLARRYTVTFGIIVNALFFAALHLLNDGISVLAFINLVLYGVFASVMFVKTGNIWMCSAVHSIWNFVQGNIYGIQVSGNELMDTVFVSDFVSGKELINGGAFGLEGGLGVTIVLVIGIVVLAIIPMRKDARGETAVKED